MVTIFKVGIEYLSSKMQLLLLSKKIEVHTKSNSLHKVDLLITLEKKTSELLIINLKKECCYGFLAF